MRHVYKRGRRFETLAELEEKVREAWDNISTDYLFELYHLFELYRSSSMSRRLIQVIEKGGETSY